MYVSITICLGLLFKYIVLVPGFEDWINCSVSNWKKTCDRKSLLKNTHISYHLFRKLSFSAVETSKLCLTAFWGTKTLRIIVSLIGTDESLLTCFVYQNIKAFIHHWTHDSSWLVPDHLQYADKLVECIWHDNIFINMTCYSKAVANCKKSPTIKFGPHSFINGLLLLHRYWIASATLLPLARGCRWAIP